MHEAEYHRLDESLKNAHEESQLPEAPTAQGALSDLLVRLRAGFSLNRPLDSPQLHGGKTKSTGIAPGASNPRRNNRLPSSR